MRQAAMRWGFLVAGAAMLALAGCSGSGESGAQTNAQATSVGPRSADQKASVSTALAGTVAGDHGMHVVKQAAPKKPIYLYDLLQHTGFANALSAVKGGQDLPDWVHKGGTATPVEQVTVDGQSFELAQACKPHDCPSESIALLYAPQTAKLVGVFIKDPVSGTDAGVSDKATFSWLGEPDAKVKSWLKARVQRQ